ncbi:hypothetical protein ACO0QE_001255 [Hanseniaspora vineae]
MSSTTATQTTDAPTFTDSVNNAPHEYKFYNYDPSKALTYVAFILFGIWTLIIGIEIFVEYVRTVNLFKTTLAYDLHRAQIRKTIKSVCLFSYIPLILGGLMEMGGYIGRLASIYQTHTIIAFVVETVLILIAPVLISATIYMLFHRLLKYLNVPENSRIGIIFKNSLMVKFFVAGDIISFLLQVAGGAMTAEESTMHLGEKLVIIGLIVQLVSFGVFLFVQTHFTLRYEKFCENFFHLEVTGKWKIYNYSLLMASVLIFVRSIMRVAEFGQGYDGYIGTHEVFLYVFDALLMLMTLMVLSVSFFFTDIGEIYFQHFTITYSQNEAQSKLTACKTNTIESYEENSNNDFSVV